MQALYNSRSTVQRLVQISFEGPQQDDDIFQIYELNLPIGCWQYDIHCTLERAGCFLQTEHQFWKSIQFMLRRQWHFVLSVCTSNLASTKNWHQELSTCALYVAIIDIRSLTGFGRRPWQYWSSDFRSAPWSIMISLFLWQIPLTIPLWLFRVSTGHAKPGLEFHLPNFLCFWSCTVHGRLDRGHARLG